MNGGESLVEPYEQYALEKCVTTREEAMDALWERYAAIPVLRQAADGKRLVRGCGPLNAPVVIVGEAPGKEEEEAGAPFVGPAGRLLQKMLGEAGIPWGECYVTNVLPWRPPGNRTPYPFQVQASRGRVLAEIGLTGPQVVITCGTPAWNCVTGDPGSLPEWRGRLRDDAGPWLLLPVYHPSAILHAVGATRAQMRASTVAAFRSVLEG